MHVCHFPTPILYAAGLRLQQDLVEGILAGTMEETLLLLEHEPVYTIGRLRDQSSLRNPSTLPHPIVETNRGGQATYHGPGQLVGYPIIDLNPRGRDLHKHLRMLEEALIRVCTAYGIPAGRREGLTGVWVEQRKLASLGVGVRRWITMHGFALNVTHASLPPFLAITPCGLDGVTMTCMEAEVGHSLSVVEVAEATAQEISSLLARA